MAKAKPEGKLQENQGLNSGIPKHRGPDEETKNQIRSRLERSGKGRARGGIRTLQNLADGALTSEESQEFSEAAKVEDAEAAEKAAEASDVTVVTAK